MSSRCTTRVFGTVRESIEQFTAVRHPREPAFSNPSVPRGSFVLAMRALVVGRYEGADGLIESGEIKHWVGASAPGPEVPGEDREEFGVDGVEEAFDLAAALGPAEGGMDDADAQFDGGALEVVACGVGAVVEVEDVGYSTHRPRRIGLPPDLLSESKCCVNRGRCPNEDDVAADRV